MWIDGEGGVHTVALPDPTVALTDAALASFLRLRDAVGAARIERLLADEEDALLDVDHVADADEAFAFQPPPANLLDGDLASVGALVAAVHKVPERWRLDVLEALSDLNDEG